MKNLIIVMLLALCGAVTTGCGEDVLGLEKNQVVAEYNEVADAGNAARAELNAAVARHNRSKGSKAQLNELEDLKAKLTKAMNDAEVLRAQVQGSTISNEKAMEELGRLKADLLQYKIICHEIAR